MIHNCLNISMVNHQQHIISIQHRLDMLQYKPQYRFHLLCITNLNSLKDIMYLIHISKHLMQHYQPLDNLRYTLYQLCRYNLIHKLKHIQLHCFTFRRMYIHYRQYLVNRFIIHLTSYKHQLDIIRHIIYQLN